MLFLDWAHSQEGIDNAKKSRSKENSQRIQGTISFPLLEVVIFKI